MKKLMLAAALIAVLGIGIVGVGRLFPAGQEAEGAQKEAAGKVKVVRHLDAMVDAARSTWDAMTAEYDVGTPRVSIDELYAWSSRWRAAEVRATQSKREVARAYENHLARMRGLHAKVEALFKAQAKGGEASKLQAAKYYLAEAELLLAEAQDTI
jgi:hypothetical protein